VKSEIMTQKLKSRIEKSFLQRFLKSKTETTKRLRYEIQESRIVGLGFKILMYLWMFLLLWILNVLFQPWCYTIESWNNKEDYLKTYELNRYRQNV
jgi:hypothetical protein